MVYLAGGFIGYFLGTSMARYAGPLFAGMDITVPWRADLFAAALGLGLIIGILSSLYPAWLAAKQDPVEALRSI